MTHTPPGNDAENIPFDLLYNRSSKGDGIPDNVDDLIDALPLHTQNKVLATFGKQQEDIYARAPTTRLQTFIWMVKFGLAVLWAVGCLVLAFAASITVVLIPLAMVLFVASGVPLGVLVSKRYAPVRQSRNPEEGQEDE